MLKYIDSLSIRIKIKNIVFWNLLFLVMITVTSLVSFNSAKNIFSDIQNKQLKLTSIATSISKDISKLQNIFLTASASSLKINPNYKKQNSNIQKDIELNIVKLILLSKDKNFASLKEMIKNISLRTKSLGIIGIGMVEDFNDKDSDTIDKIDAIEGYDSVARKTKIELKKLVDFSNTSLTLKIKSFKNYLVNMVIIILLIAVIALICSLFFGTLFGTSIQNSLNNFRNGLLGFFKYLNREQANINSLDESSKDELGQMAKVINENISSIEKGLIADAKAVEDTASVVNKIKAGYLNAQITVIANNPQLIELSSVVNEMIRTTRTNIQNTLNILNSYSSNDFTSKVERNNLEGEMGSLVDGINNLGNEISNMLSLSLKNGMSLQGDAAALKQVVESISKSSNEQAISLEETVVAMKEMTNNVQGNAKKSDDMAVMAIETDNSAKDGAELANKTSQAMDDIQIATTSIDSAIETIENIAFQTNILSLNAAVEAATAGEAGKGFAVVAQEVRNLANRSAEAAREIKKLAEQATTKSQEGITIASELTKGFEVIADKIEKTSELVQYVSDAGREQMSGISQINTAITQLDQMTQQNAKTAIKADSIANATIEKAELMLNDANSKNFIGKE